MRAKCVGCGKRFKKGENFYLMNLRDVSGDVFAICGNRKEILQTKAKLRKAQREEGDE